MLTPIAPTRLLAGCCLLLLVASTAHAQRATCDFRAPSSRDASWSPDGTTLVFDSNRDGNQEIYSMKADGSDPRRLTYHEGADYYPFFSPDGKRLVFMSFSDGEGALYVMKADGSDLTRLTDEGSTNADPSWSPDGRHLAFFSERDGNAEIYVMNADGSDQQRLTHTPANENTPTWSPDGSLISFISDRDGNAEIYVMNADGTHPRRLTDDPRSDRVARWSPDGRALIFYAREPLPASSTREQRDQSWAGAELYTIAADGTNRTRLTHNDHLDQAPVWSPDGSKIVFTSCRTGNRETFVMDADGSNVEQLTFTGNQ